MEQDRVPTLIHDIKREDKITATYLTKLAGEIALDVYNAITQGHWEPGRPPISVPAHPNDQPEGAFHILIIQDPTIQDFTNVKENPSETQEN